MTFVENIQKYHLWIENILKYPYLERISQVPFILGEIFSKYLSLGENISNPLSFGRESLKESSLLGENFSKNLSFGKVANL